MSFVIKSNGKRYWSIGRDLADPNWTREIEEATKYASEDEAKKSAAFFHIIEPNIVEVAKEQEVLTECAVAAFEDMGVIKGFLKDDHKTDG